MWSRGSGIDGKGLEASRTTGVPVNEMSSVDDFGDVDELYADDEGDGSLHDKEMDHELHERNRLSRIQVCGTSADVPPATDSTS